MPDDVPGTTRNQLKCLAVGLRRHFGIYKYFNEFAGSPTY